MQWSSLRIMSAGEPDILVPDILTCGACQKHFPLGDIVRFIQHKVQLCNKENNSLGSSAPFLYDSDDDDDEERGPASSPLLVVPKKELPEDSEERRVKEEPVSSSSIIKRALSAKDAASATQHEPRHYVCSTCKQSLSTAWTLIQHVQDVHGLSICSTDPPPADDPHLGLRAPLLERQPLPLFGTSRSSSQELRLDLKSSSNGPVTPPPLLEPPKISSFQDSSYSQRLRVLAGATSPNASSTPRKLLQSSFKAMLNNNSNKTVNGSPPHRSGTPPELSSSLSPPQSSTTSNNNHNHNSSASSTTSDHPPPPQTISSSSPKSSGGGNHNNRLCEYCGKSFQFKSNLIVHRRSHTGEKPFKCHVCDHACTQASKLKRHMKTHRKQGGRRPAATKSSNSKSSSSTANGEEEDETKEAKQTKCNGECGSEDEDLMDEEVEDEEEEEEDEEINVDGLEDEGDRLLRENGNLVIDHPDDEDMVAEDLTKKKSPPLNNGTPENGRGREQPARHSSVIGEIMEKIGFGCIPPYNEAYKQALKESSYHRNNSLKQDRCSSGTEASNDAVSHHSYDVLSSFHHHLDRPPREGTRSAGQSPLGFGLLDSLDHSSSMKRIRLQDESKEGKGDGGTHNNFLYAGVWFPRVETQSHQYHRDLYGLDANSSKSESALRPGPSSGSSKPNGKDPSSQAAPRRNDTCEFCGKVFKNCSNLTVHRRSHTGEKPYKCELCSYACAQSSKLTRHMKTHGRLGKDVYRCRFCDMPFSVASTLEKHMRKCVVSQSGGSPYLVSEDSKEMTA